MKLTEGEKSELRHRGLAGPQEPLLPRRSPREYLDFVTQASCFARVHKPVRFTGKFWRL